MKVTSRKLSATKNKNKMMIYSLVKILRSYILIKICLFLYKRKTETQIV